ncbi:Serine--tRNA ligase [Gossypium arboreum]|uniref:Serine--tRNA ligase n=1 Tax=Gossypium arboreum TaxID=29729 RepID=A0A0B0MK59_GOSAR|nr:Serine--tRNA ligase [Gossypium arboreum]
MFMGVVEPIIKHGHLFLVHSVVNFLRMLTMTYLKRMRKKILNDVHIDGNNQKRKTLEISTSQFKTGRKKSSKQIGGAAKCPVKLKNYTIQLTIWAKPYSLTPSMDPYGIPQVVKVLDSMLDEVPEVSPLYFFSLKLLLNKDKRTMFYQLIPRLELYGLSHK